MQIVIAGGSGFLGTALTRVLSRDGHNVTVLTRQSRTDHLAELHVAYVTWHPNGESGPWASTINGADVVVNLAGESIAAKRWSAAQKQKLRDSRLMATRSLTAAIREAKSKPRVLISGSAVGYYGDRGEETLTETSAPGRDFLAGLAQEWETAATEVATLTRVVFIRTGIVLDRRGGALPKMLPPFLMFAGGPLGSGKQYMPWIHKEDWIRLVAWTMTTEGARGAINATNPRPITNREFSRALGRALTRPSLLPAPAFALRLALGEMADALLLSGQRALPVRATDLGFVFRYTDVDEALTDIFRNHIS
ncbi:MAG TPA: TIGR01777 family oxidoreductase [Vicinamibacterales bacterium]|nr:TIGR01777 family oxidoreductase [Vicinamibacterales bacterium]